MLTLEQAIENVLTFELKTAEGAKTYNLVLNFDAIINAEGLTGINFAVPFNWQKLSAANLSVILWCSMLKYQPEVTLENVREWIPPANYADIFAALIELCHPGFVERCVEAFKKTEAGENQPSAV
jgi:hypothetical protein